MRKQNDNNGQKNNTSIESIKSKRMTWNIRRKYNYKYVTTVF